jgi:hypothetical protein
MRCTDKGSDLSRPPMNFSLNEVPFSRQRSFPHEFQIASPKQVSTLRERWIPINLSAGSFRKGKA